MRPAALLILLLLLQSCEKSNISRSYLHNIEWTNETDHTIVEEKYHADTLVGRFTYGPGETVMSHISYTGKSKKSFRELLYADSVIVTFDSTRRQVYYIGQDNHLMSLPHTSRNYFSKDSYEEIKENYFEFSFTEKDYIQAAPINPE